MSDLLPPWAREKEKPNAALAFAYAALLIILFIVGYAIAFGADR